MRRWDFIGLLGDAAAAWPIAVRAQQSGRFRRIGFLGSALITPASTAAYRAFRMQHALDDPRGPFIVAAELTRSQPDLIVTSGLEASFQAVIGASGFVPVVMIAINFDPLAQGYIPNLARPAGNITGLVLQQLELAHKQVELLNQAFPDRARLAILFDAQSADRFGAAVRAETRVHHPARRRCGVAARGASAAGRLIGWSLLPIILTQPAAEVPCWPGLFPAATTRIQRRMTH